MCIITQDRSTSLINQINTSARNMEYSSIQNEGKRLNI